VFDNDGKKDCNNLIGRFLPRLKSGVSSANVMNFSKIDIRNKNVITQIRYNESFTYYLLFLKELVHTRQCGICVR
jgi:hypothetical protein